MRGIRICGVIVDKDVDSIKQLKDTVDFYEVRIDLIGEGWQDLVKKLKRPWIACNRISTEGGKWQGGEEDRIAELYKAVEIGARMVDIELNTESLNSVITNVKRKAKCLVSFHDFQGTPSLNELVEIVEKQIAAGADICKVVTTASKFEDNMTTLKLLSLFPRQKLVAFAMGEEGLLSRILCPMAGSRFTYASIAESKESALGQFTVGELLEIYSLIR